MSRQWPRLSGGVMSGIYKESWRREANLSSFGGLKTGLAGSGQEGLSKARDRVQLGCWSPSLGGRLLAGFHVHGYSHLMISAATPRFRKKMGPMQNRRDRVFFGGGDGQKRVGGVLRLTKHMGKQN